MYVSELVHYGTILNLRLHSEAGFTRQPMQDDSAQIVCTQNVDRTQPPMPTVTTSAGMNLRQLADRDERVFPSYPQVARYFPSSSAEDARRRLSRAIDRGDGPGLVIGAPGTGKSLLLQVLAAQYHEQFDVVLLACARLCTRRALMQAILFELGLPYKMRDEGELRLGLLDHLLSTQECPSGLLLLVDEAQTLPITLLDELRVVTNLMRGGSPRVRLVLAGSSALEEAFAHPALESFSQRLASRCYVAPLRRDETAQFIRAHVAASGGAPDEVFAGDAWEAVFDATDGVPRLVNQLCDRALWLAVNEGRSQIDCHVIQAAWSDLQQLPMPWETPASSTAEPAASQVVEFGGLSDDTAADDWQHDSLLEDIDPTELDANDVVSALDEDEIGLADEESTATSVTADPFTEQFDEEEVVLDNFAAWDDMFRRETPRVANRRDPGFSSLVQAAIDAVPLSPIVSNTSSELAAIGQFDLDEFEVNEVADLTDLAIDELAIDELEDSSDESTFDWPPLRLAVVSEAATQSPISPARDDLMAAFRFDDIKSQSLGFDSPVLIVEDEATPGPGKPPVRREDYRHLFSRLRSG